MMFTELMLRLEIYCKPIVHVLLFPVSSRIVAAFLLLAMHRLTFFMIHFILIHVRSRVQLSLSLSSIGLCDDVMP